MKVKKILFRWLISQVKIAHDSIATNGVALAEELWRATPYDSEEETQSGALTVIFV
ncbi:MAG: hypothetical protein WC249_01550 [Patescibacteria group bacterium]